MGIEVPVPQPAPLAVTFSLEYNCAFGQNIYLSGSSSSLGGWDVEKAVPLEWTDGDRWSATVELEAG